MGNINNYESEPFFDEITTKIVALIIFAIFVLITLVIPMFFPKVIDYLCIFLIFGSIVVSVIILLKKIFNLKYFHLLFWFQLSILFCFYILIFARTYYADIGDNTIIFLEIFTAIVFLLLLAFAKHKKYFYYLLIFITIIGVFFQYNNFSFFSKHSSTESYMIQKKYIHDVRKSVTDKYIFFGTSPTLGKIEDDIGLEIYNKYSVGDEISVNYYKGLMGLDFYRY